MRGSLPPRPGAGKRRGEHGELREHGLNRVNTAQRSDVLVIGGGPAGLAAAIAVRLGGRQVVVLEPRPMPIDKPCGEGLMPDAVASLEALGVDLAGAGMPIRGIAWIDSAGAARGHFPAHPRPGQAGHSGRPGRGIRRLELHRRLERRAVEVGVEVRVGERAVRVDLEPDGAEVASDRARYRARFVIAADGLRSAVRRWAGLEAPQATSPVTGARRRRRFGVRRHFLRAPWSDHVEVHWGDDGVEAYVTPIGPGEIGVAMLWSDGALDGALGGTLDGNRDGGVERAPVFERLLARFPELEQRLAGAAASSPTMGTGPLRQLTSRVCRGPLALLGDASGYRDAITGEGLAVAFHQALALGRSLERGDLRGYARSCPRLVRRPNAITELVLLLSRHPALRRRVLAVLGRDPTLFDALLAAHVGALRAPGLAWSATRLGLRLAALRQ